MPDLSNDNESPRTGCGSHRADAHGEAALLLVESLIHGLIARSVIGVEDAVDVVTIAIDADLEIAADRGDVAEAMNTSVSLLSTLRESLSHDIR